MHFLISGGEGKLATLLCQEIHKDQQNSVWSPNKKHMNIEKIEDIKKHIQVRRPYYFIHCAALTKPLLKHEENPSLSISTNIIGTANVVKCCIKYNIKLIYISTDYVYPGTKGNYTEESPLLPCTNYGWSKLGGECAVQMYKNSLILRIAMCNHPWSHLQAFTDDCKNWIYDNEVASIILKLKDKFGIINVGGKPKSSYEFAKKENPNIQKKSIKEITNVKLPQNTSMNLEKMKYAM